MTRVAGFCSKANEGKPVGVSRILANIRACQQSAKPFDEESLLICAAYCKDAGINRDNAFDYFDEDHNGVIDRGEIFRGFKKIGAGVNKRHIINMWTVLDRNYDHDVSTDEFESMFSKYLDKGPQSKDAKAGQLRIVPTKITSEGLDAAKKYSVVFKLMNVNGIPSGTKAECDTSEAIAAKDKEIQFKAGKDV